MGNTGPLPAAFLSYARMPNDEENDRIKTFRTKLAYEVEILTGRSFSIFLDTSDIRPGQPWPDTIAEKLDSSRLLIALLTPRFFNSDECRKEVEYFLKVEAGFKRRDLIIPIQYVTVPELIRTDGSASDLVELMKIRQVVDGTLFRLSNFKSLRVKTELSKLATEIVNRLQEFPETAAVATVSGQPQSGDPEIDRPRAVEIAPTPATLTQAAPVTEPRLRIVDKSKGPYRSVVQALDAALAGDRILVHPGTYRGGLVVDKAIEIVGEGNPEEIVLEAAGVNTLAFRTGFGRVANLTLRQTGRGGLLCSGRHPGKSGSGTLPHRKRRPRRNRGAWGGGESDHSQ